MDSSSLQFHLTMQEVKPHPDVPSFSKHKLHWEPRGEHGVVLSKAVLRHINAKVASLALPVSSRNHFCSAFSFVNETVFISQSGKKIFIEGQTF